MTGAAFGRRTDMNGVKVSFHPAGHVLGSAQVRVEHRGEVWVVTGDYKLEDDGISGAFEPVKCNTFITESTFGLPVYRWQPQSAVATEIDEWWRRNQELGRASVLYTYSLGKAQRVLSLLDRQAGPICVHQSVAKLNAAYRAEGIDLPADTNGDDLTKEEKSRAIIVAPSATEDSRWLRGFRSQSTGFVSGWMRIRGGRRRGNYDRGFVMSDHVDWPGMLSAIKDSEAERILVTHGYAAQAVRYLQEQGKDAGLLETKFGSDGEE